MKKHISQFLQNFNSLLDPGVTVYEGVLVSLLLSFLLSMYCWFVLSAMMQYQRDIIKLQCRPYPYIDPTSY